MATNAFDALVSDVNKKLSEMGAATSEANGAAAKANDAVTEAAKQGAAAETAAQKANTAADAANALSDLWDDAQFEAVALDAGSEATVKVTEENGAKKVTFGLPRGAKGADGPKGDTGKSGVTFQLSGTKLYITTE